jgi:uncharacterized protein (DUF58 family)
VPADGRIQLSSEELLRAARILTVRSRREATGLFAGNYRSAFRGGGLEFEESRPYVQGDDVRSIDWNATARNDELFVKRFREERDQTLLFAIDVSASMRFGSAGRAKAATAAHALALMAAAAGRAGDALGVVAFDRTIRDEVPIARGASHSWRVIRAAVTAASESAGKTDIAAGLRAVHRHTRRRAVLILLSDLRDGEAAGGGLRREFASLSHRHDVIAACVVDPREEELPAVGSLRIEDPENPGRTLLLASGSRRTRERYRAACQRRRQRIESDVRKGGADILWLRTDRNPLYALGRFFHERAGRRSRGIA